MDTTQYIAAWARAGDAFNQGDLEAFGQVLADRCQFNTSAGPVGSTRDEIVASMNAGRDAGWVSHNLLSIVTGGALLASTSKNDFAGGSSHVGAGIARFGADGKITELQSLNPSGFVPRMSAG